MARTQPGGKSILDGSLQRTDMDTTTAGQAVITKVIAGTHVSLTQTGTDAGTGDVTVNVEGVEPADSAIQTHITSTHAPSDAQKNSNITKAEIEAKLTGSITTHTHPGYLQQLALSGLGFNFSTTVGGNPAVGELRVGNGALTTATLLHVSETDTGSQNVDTLLDLLKTPGCWIKLYDRLAPETNYHWYQTTASFASTGAPLYDPIPVVWRFGVGTFTATTKLDFVTDLLSPVPGANKQLIFNDSGNLGADAALTFDKALKQLLLAAGMIGNTAIANPTPVAATLLQYVGDFGGRLMPKFMGPSGMDWPVQPHIGFQKVSCVQATGSAMYSQGTAAMTSTGGSAIAYAAATTGSILNQLAKIVLATGTTAATVTYFRPPTGNMQCYIGNAANSGGFTFMCRFSLGTMQSGQRIFVGLHPRGTAPTNQDPINEINVIGLTCIANSGNWAISSNDATSTGVATTMASPAIPVNTTDLIELTMYCAPNSSSVSYRVVDWTTGAVYTGTLTTQLPVANTVLAPMIWMTNNAQAASVVLNVNKIYLETDY